MSITVSKKIVAGSKAFTGCLYEYIGMGLYLHINTSLAC